jgi:hypothetical protein
MGWWAPCCSYSDSVGPTTPLADPVGRAVAEDAALATLEAAWAAGIRAFDTAPHYGVGLSELRIGRFPAGRPRGEYAVLPGRDALAEPAGQSEGPAGWRRLPGRRTIRRRILRPSIVHVRSQPVQPRSSPNFSEVLPVFPTVPPQRQRSPDATLCDPRATLRINTGTGLAAGRFSWRTYTTARPTMTTTTKMTVAAK